MPSLPSQARIFAIKSSSRPDKKNLKRPCLVQKLVDLCSQGHIKEAVDSLGLLARKGLRLDSNTRAFLLQQCASSKSIKLGKWIHLHLKLTGLKHPNTFLANHLINMYSKCGDHVEARKIFDKMTTKNMYSWNSMLSGYAKLGMAKPARRLFDKMAQKDIVSWNIMVIAYAQSGHIYEALRFYRESRASNVGFNEYTFAGVITVCVKAKELILTRQVHCQVLVAGFLSNLVLSSSILGAYAMCEEMGDARRLFDAMRTRDVLTWTTLVSGYAKWGDMKSARELFNMMPEKNPVSWTALIAGYARNACGNEAVILLAEMIKHQVKPNQFTFSSCLSACASIPSLVLGKQIHALLIVTGFRPNTILLRSLIEMYSNSGSFEDEKKKQMSLSTDNLAPLNEN
nr:pentatricopeptide repeat-containing protein At2g21090 [Ipomoea batatas]